jgi:hypothetical protein
MEAQTQNRWGGGGGLQEIHEKLASRIPAEIPQYIVHTSQKPPLHETVCSAISVLLLSILRSMNITLGHANRLLGNDSEMSSYTIAVSR